MVLGSLLPSGGGRAVERNGRFSGIDAKGAAFYLFLTIKFFMDSCVDFEPI